MKIKCREIAVFVMMAGAVCMSLTGCGAVFCGYPLTGKDDMVFACAEPDGQVSYIGEDSEDTAYTPLPEEPEADGEIPAEGKISGDGLVDLNSAGAEELMTLNGIGETRAAAIIRFREQNGPFASIEEIMMIPGIKEGIFSRIKDQIVVR